jgi:hypothetical protein
MAKARKPSKRAAAAPGGMKLSLKLDPQKIEQIQRCLKKGRLTITVSKVSALGRAENGYLYD